jgi:23S rRNA pseudouridine1911/1915/1917 synthase
MTLNRGYRYRLVLGPEAVGQSVISYLTRSFPHSSESEWLSRLETGEVELGGQTANGQEQLRPGQVLVWNRPGWTEEATPQDFEVIYEDADLLAVDKPSGLPTLPGGGFYENTLLSLVHRRWPDARPLHRLGRATSGLVLFALSPVAASVMNRRWPEVRKQYQALAQGIASHDSYDIQTPIGPVEHPRLGSVHAASPTGKPSHSIARVLERRVETTLFEVDILTGRPHQIRIHLASIGYPLFGDPLYAIGGLPRLDDPGLPGDSGYWLHAKRVVFDHPTSGLKLELMAQLPKTLCRGAL